MKQGVTEACTKWRRLFSEQSQSGQSVAAFCVSAACRGTKVARLRSVREKTGMLWLSLIRRESLARVAVNAGAWCMNCLQSLCALEGAQGART
jgi:hypothetical protein